MPSARQPAARGHRVRLGAALERGIVDRLFLHGDGERWMREAAALRHRHDVADVDGQGVAAQLGEAEGLPVPTMRRPATQCAGSAAVAGDCPGQPATMRSAALPV